MGQAALAIPVGWVADIKLRATRRLGELSRELEKAASGRAAVSLPSGGKSKTETLKAAGISTSAAHRAERLAEIPEADFEAPKGKNRSYKKGRDADTEACNGRVIQWQPGQSGGIHGGTGRPRVVKPVDESGGYLANGGATLASIHLYDVAPTMNAGPGWRNR